LHCFHSDTPRGDAAYESLILIFNSLDSTSSGRGHPMIVCHCYCISDREIRSCARQGASSVGEVGRLCDAGTGCGGCRPEIASILDGERRPMAAAEYRSLPVLQSA
jgi:bacterioferritin-associated ferredoxin